MSSESGPPCCCMPLQKGVLILATIDAVLNIAIIILWGLLMLIVFKIFPGSEDEKIVVTVLFVMIIIFCGINIALAVCLRRGAQERNPQTCLVWLIITGTMWVISFTGLGVQATSEKPNYAWIGCCGIRLLYILYQMWVVLSFRNEIVRNGTIFQYPFAMNTVSVNIVTPYPTANPYPSQVPSQSHTAAQSQALPEGVVQYPYPQSQG